MKRLVCGLLILFSFNLQAAQQVRVGVYDFPPFVRVDKRIEGPMAELVNIMNQSQQKYNFVMVPTTAKRRYKDFEQRMFDVLMFESKSWGWNKYSVSTSQAFLQGAEVYVSLEKPGRGQAFFSNFKDKSLIGVLGYHYGFARFHAERDYLERHFDIILTDSQVKSMELLLKGRGEIAVLSLDYLNYHFKHHPEDKAKLLISTKRDQVYRHTMLIRNGLKGIDVRSLNQLIGQMNRNGTLLPLWEKYQLGQK